MIGQGDVLEMIRSHPEWITPAQDTERRQSVIKRPKTAAMPPTVEVVPAPVTSGPQGHQGGGAGYPFPAHSSLGYQPHYPAPAPSPSHLPAPSPSYRNQSAYPLSPSFPPTPTPSDLQDLPDLLDGPLMPVSPAGAGQGAGQGPRTPYQLEDLNLNSPVTAPQPPGLAQAASPLEATLNPDDIPTDLHGILDLQVLY